MTEEQIYKELSNIEIEDKGRNLFNIERYPNLLNNLDLFEKDRKLIIEYDDSYFRLEPKGKRFIENYDNSKSKN